jgi:ankyrin repeat protein
MTSMAMMILATFFFSGCIDYSGMMMESDEDTFFKAVDRGDVKAVKKFLENGEDINARNQWDETALIVAAGDGDLEMVQMLIEAGADVNAIETDVNPKVKTTALLVAVKRDYAEITQILIDAGADLNMRYKYDTSILSEAVMSDAVNAAQALLDAGAEIEAANEKGETSLFIAAAYGRKALPLLIRAGANVNTKNTSGDTALMFAAMTGELESIRQLLKAGADVNVAGPLGNTALIYAAGMLRSRMESYKVDEATVTAMVKELLDAGADVTPKNTYKENALAAAKKEGHEDAVQLLINAGAK